MSQLDPNQLDPNQLDPNQLGQRYLDRMHAFGDVVHATRADQWDRPSPCPAWTAAGVVDHVVDTQRDFWARHGLPAGARPAGTPVEIWDQHLTTAGEIADEATLAIGFDGFFGPTTVGSILADFYGFDVVVHRWDLARAGGLGTAFTDAELDALETAVAGFGDHLYADGVCGPAVPTPAGASRQDRLLGVLGRDARTPVH